MIDVNGLLESQQELIDKLTEQVEVLQRIIKIHESIDAQNEIIIKHLGHTAPVNLKNKLIEEKQ